MLAVYRCNGAVVEQLLKHGPRLDARDVNHETVLHLASRKRIKGKYTSEPTHDTERNGRDPPALRRHQWI